MLNLLIAIIGNSYNKIIDSEQKVFYRNNLMQTNFNYILYDFLKLIFIKKRHIILKKCYSLNNINHN